MGLYLMKNMSIDLVNDTASVCIACDSGKRPTVINLSFPLSVGTSHSETDLRNQARDKVRLVLSRALESINQDA